MPTESESTSVNCVLCGHTIEPGEPAQLIFTGRYNSDQYGDDFKGCDKLGFACDCLLRAAERHAEGLPVYSDDRNAMEYAAQCIVGMNKD